MDIKYYDKLYGERKLEEENKCNFCIWKERKWFSMTSKYSLDDVNDVSENKIESLLRKMLAQG